MIDHPLLDLTGKIVDLINNYSPEGFDDLGQSDLIYEKALLMALFYRTSDVRYLQGLERVDEKEES